LHLAFYFHIIRTIILFLMLTYCAKSYSLLIACLLLCSVGKAQKYYFKKIGIAEGLSHSSVFCIAQDYKGFMWFGTRGGLDVFNGSRIKTYTFKSHLPNVEAQRVNCLLALDKELYIGTGMQFMRYDFTQDALINIPLSMDTSIFVNNINPFSEGVLIATQAGLFAWKNQKVHSILRGGKNVRQAIEYRKNVLMVLENNDVRLVNTEGQGVVDIIKQGITPNTPFSRIETLYKDLDGKIWAGTNHGIFLFDETALQFKQPTWFPSTTELVRTIVTDKQGQLWVGTETGVFVFNPQTQSLRHYGQSYDASLSSLSDKAIYSAFVSRDGIVWLGSYFAGVNYTLPNNTAFNFLMPTANQTPLSGKAVSTLINDAQQNLWIATEDGGVTVLDKDLKLLKIINQTNGLSDNNVHAILPEANGTVWIGTFMGGLNKLNAQSGTITNFKHQPNNPNSLSNNSIYALCKDKNGLLWVGTQSGLNQYDAQNNTWKRVLETEFGQKFIYDIHEDKQGKLWFATRYDGCYHFDPLSKKLEKYHTGNVKGLKSNQFIEIYEDSKQRIWFGTIDGGFCVFDNNSQRFIEFDTPPQYPDATIYGVLEDDAQCMWFSTNKGLVKYNPKTQETWTFDRSSGLMTTQFNFKSSFKNTNGTLFFGTVNGLTYFQPQQLNQHIATPSCYFTDLKIFNQAVTVGASSVLKKHLDETEAIELTHSQNIISIDFVALNYFSSGNNYYTYYLDGFEKTWNPKTLQNSVTYTNLPAGSYTFHLKSFKSDGSLGGNERTLKIKIHPPFWRSPLAYLFYLGLLGLAIYYYYRFNKFVNEQKLAVQLERMEKEKNSALNQQKLNFFTFISNEFKTPLTLITAALDQIMGAEPLSKDGLKHIMPTIRRNAQHLQMLIEQFLTLQKTSENPQNEIVQLDLIDFIKENIAAFQPLIDAKQLAVKTVFAMPYLSAKLDANKLELILGNLLFSIFSKMTAEQAVSINISVKRQAEIPTLLIEIEGALPPSVLDNFQSETDTLGGNSVSLTSNLITHLIAQLNGFIEIEPHADSPKLGLHIPYQPSTASLLKNPKQEKRVGSTWIKLMAEYDAAVLPTTQDTPTPLSIHKPKILIAEKNADLVSFLKSHFADHYDIITANSHNKAFEKALTTLPELILCDSHLTNENGISLCQDLKTHPQTSFISVILLTDDDSEQSRLNALSLGADSHLQKPFKMKELDLMVQNMLKSQRLIKEKFAGTLKSEDLYGSNKQYDFLQKFTKLIEKHYQDPNLNVDFLAQSMNCSRSTLHAKLKPLTNLSTVEFLNDYRLTMAHQLLTQGVGVAEAAQQVGFGDANYFSRIYKKKYGHSPRQAKS
jgi:ligand-binding sensor domain-containing protein/AraC-like DNA-binding protein/CheY-like chemotaxis protein